MIIIPSAVEANKPKLHKIFDLRSGRIDHTNHRLTFALELPVNEKEVRKHLNVVKDYRSFMIYFILRSLIRLKVHLIYKLNTVFSLMRAAGSKGKYSVTHVSNIVLKTAIISVLKDLINKIDTRLSCRMDLFIKISLYNSPKSFFTFYTFEIYHSFLSFQW